MPYLIWHDYLVVVSFVACAAGLLLLFNTTQTSADELEETERSLLAMSFCYWMVYCVAFSLQKMASSSSDTLLLSLKLTTAFAYFLTFSCILSLPLHRFALWQDTKTQSSNKRYS